MNMRATVSAVLTALLFAGECMAESGLALSGRFEYRNDPTSLEMLGGLVCFYPSAESAQLLPRPQTDMRLAWFCFTNDMESKKLLDIPREAKEGGCGYTGEATVQVTKYTLHAGEGDGFDTATLQAASNIPQPRTLPCE